VQFNLWSGGTSLSFLRAQTISFSPFPEREHFHALACTPLRDSRWTFSDRGFSPHRARLLIAIGSPAIRCSSNSLSFFTENHSSAGLLRIHKVWMLGRFTSRQNKHSSGRLRELERVQERRVEVHEPSVRRRVVHAVRTHHAAPVSHLNHHVRVPLRIERPLKRGS